MGSKLGHVKIQYIFYLACKMTAEHDSFSVSFQIDVLG